MANTQTNKVSQFELPQVGLFLVDDWAKILGYEPNTLRKHIHEQNLRVLRFNGKMVVDAALFWEHIRKISSMCFKNAAQIPLYFLL